ncbi:MAG: flagellar basal body P-ring formation chaperone FlgA [Thermodesulfovibrio sp.]|nr:flagellar basal body P-ring formation chaperone FlgA [Thermodesulfovibrio sp.]
MKRRVFLISLIISLNFTFSCYVFAFDKNLLSNLLANELKKSPIATEVLIGQIKFIGYEPKEKCIPENLKIREIKRPSSVEFTFKCGSSHYRAVSNYEVLTKVYVNQIPLKKGEIITEEKIMEIKYPLSKLPTGTITDKDLILGKVVKKTLVKGLIIKEDYLYSDIPVKKGSIVNVIVDTGQVMIVTEGVLKVDATVGGKVRVQCLATGKEIAGKLIEKDKVRVSL